MGPLNVILPGEGLASLAEILAGSGSKLAFRPDAKPVNGGGKVGGIPCVALDETWACERVVVGRGGGPLEWVAPYGVGVRERLSPTKYER